MIISSIENDNEIYGAKYIILDYVCYSGNADEQVYHEKLGRRDQVHDEVLEARKNNPSKVTAGVYSVDLDAKTIEVIPGSMGYKIPIEGAGTEEMTQTTFERLAPGFLVWIADGEYYLP